METYTDASNKCSYDDATTSSMSLSMNWYIEIYSVGKCIEQSKSIDETPSQPRKPSIGNKQKLQPCKWHKTRASARLSHTLQCVQITPLQLYPFIVQ